MTPTDFPETNATFFEPEFPQSISIRAYRGKVSGGSFDGSEVLVTAWKPNPEERAALFLGAPVFISFIGTMQPHTVGTNFAAVVHPL